jgi:subtilisin
MIALNAILVTLLVASGMHEAFAASDRYVVVSKELELGRVKSDAARDGAVLEEDFRYHRGFAAKMSDQAAGKLRAKYGNKVLVEKDGIATINLRSSTTTAQPAQSSPWGIAAVKAKEAQSISRGAGAVVCIVDTGVQPNHPDLAANIAGGENFVAQKGRIEASAWADDNGHGSHVAGTIAALDNSIGVIGIAPDARLFAVKALNRQGSGYLSAIAEGIRSCIENAAHVVNMSLGGSQDSSLLRAAVQDAAGAGLIVVAAAGNESSGVSYPAKYPEVVAVSAVDSSMRLASFSNSGPEVDFAGPGVSVLSTYKGSGYATLSGTSMAAPHVAGVAALMVSSGSSGLMGRLLPGLSAGQQGKGLIDALATVENR